MIYSVTNNETGEILKLTEKVVYINDTGKIEVTSKHTPWTLFFKSKREADLMGFKEIEYKLDT
jgi:hypothetical protein